MSESFLSFETALSRLRIPEHFGIRVRTKQIREKGMIMLKRSHFLALGVLSFLTCEVLTPTARADNSAVPFVESVKGPEATLSYSEEALEKLVPTAAPADVVSPQAIIRAFHEAVSGPKGDWNADRMRSLCIPNVHLEYADKLPSGEVRIATITLDQLVAELKKLHNSTAWYEHVLNVRVVQIPRPESKATIATAIYTGVERTHPIEHYAGKGSTSITTLLYVKNRWWIVSHIW